MKRGQKPVKYTAQLPQSGSCAPRGGAPNRALLMLIVFKEKCMIWNSSCTVFNRSAEPNPETERWQASVLHGVCWQGSFSCRTREQGSFSDNAVRVYIPFLVTCQSTYLPPEAFAKTPANHWTLREGDVLVYGAHRTLPPFLSAYEICGHFTRSMVITGITTNDFGSPALHHWEVMENEYDRRR